MEVQVYRILTAIGHAVPDGSLVAEVKEYLILTAIGHAVLDGPFGGGGPRIQDTYCHRSCCSRWTLGLWRSKYTGYLLL